MKIAIVTAVWQRPEVFEMFAKGVKHLQQNTQHELITIVSGSEGQRSRTMVERQGFVYIEIPNNPLAVKHNAAVLKAREYGVDYVLFMGSDDIVSPGLLSVYDRYIVRGYDFMGVTDFYFYDVVTKKGSYWGGYLDNRKGHTAGAARLISKRLLNAWGWQPFEVKDSHVLDNSVQDKLRYINHLSVVVNMKDHGVFALDIKSSVNMTKFELWPNTQIIDTQIIKNQFPYLF